jgi:hypothetical protein
VFASQRRLDQLGQQLSLRPFHTQGCQWFGPRSGPDVASGG